VTIQRTREIEKSLLLDFVLIWVGGFAQDSRIAACSLRTSKPAGATLKAAPGQVVLRFSERLESAFCIKSKTVLRFVFRPMIKGSLSVQP
jgi:methionine-rich copper-binding protein CopC